MHHLLASVCVRGFLVLGFAVAPLSARQTGLQDLGLLGTGTSATRAEAHAISADGSFIVGLSSVGGTALTHGFMWGAPSGMADLAPQSSNFAMFGVSDDGAVAVGDACVTGSGWVACRWDATTGVGALGMMPGSSGLFDHSKASAVSADGRVIVGYEQRYWGFDDSEDRGFVWTRQAGFTDVGHLTQVSSVRQTQALDVSADGSVVVGWSINSNGRARAFRWTATGGMVDLGVTSGLSSDNSFAWGISGDGLVIVGGSGNASPGGGQPSTMRPFRWTAGTGVQTIATPGGAPGVAIATNADGSVVVGNYFAGGVRGFRWTASGGAEDLGTLGGDLQPKAVSGDGAVVVGLAKVGFQTRAFRWSVNGMETRYCAALPNSTGQTGRLAVFGNNIIANNHVVLAASNLPVQSTGYFIASMNTGSTIPFNSQGLLCLAQPIKRFAGPGQVISSGASGAFTLALDLTSFSSGAGVFGVQAGDTWKFQAWRRDPGPPTTTNLTDAVSVTFR